MWCVIKSGFLICFLSIFFLVPRYVFVLLTVMALEGVTKRTEHHGYNIDIYLQE